MIVFILVIMIFSAYYKRFPLHEWHRVHAMHAILKIQLILTASTKLQCMNNAGMIAGKAFDLLISPIYTVHWYSKSFLVA